MASENTYSPVGAGPGEVALNLSWQQPGGLASLSFVNMFLRLFTLGIYHFWAKTEVRKRIWSAIRINGEPLSYTGRGMELFLGFLIVFLVVLLPIILGLTALIMYFGPDHIVTNVATVALYVGFAFLIGIAIYRAMRYRLARTRWRGIRGSLEGSPMAFAWTNFWTMILIPLTLGWIVPWRTTKLQSIMTNNMRFGNRPLRFDATSGPLYGPFALLWIGGILLYVGLFAVLGAYFYQKVIAARNAGLPFLPSQQDIVVVVLLLVLAGFLFALVSSWYKARTINHFARHTHFENAHFRGKLTATGLIWLTISNYLILLAGALLMAGVIIAVAAPFVDFNNLRAPEGRAVTQVMLSILPLFLLMGFTLFGPIVQARVAGYIVRNLSIKGTAALGEIEQAAGSDVRYGEGLAEAFDVDAF